MKHYLLSLAVLLGATSAQAQLIPGADFQSSLGLPQALRQKLGLNEPQMARPSTTVRRPGTITAYYPVDTTGTWSTIGEQTRCTYDNQGRISQLLMADSATQRPNRRIRSNYNAAGLETDRLQETWDGATWQNSYRSLSTYNSLGSMTEYLEQIWKNGTWQNDSRVTISYDARNHYLQYLNEAWRNNAWVATSGGRATVTYNAAGAILQETEDALDPSTNTYIPGRAASIPTPARLPWSIASGLPRSGETAPT
ncbi:hypothetical protein [Hymenobacter cellulosilyticus]|uniref:RHS repeat protein n=1 Tax=Hymenobacter cellulosilyticus TaxID=2932248 RepID=A0A8T9QCF1_9BACT|nr:hypothetical protein [Hymenobacter cellulosilyticus]UOQ74612.1 hypothetical protein MUN79_12515 [Hymenobacter cellulosilyticus]